MKPEFESGAGRKPRRFWRFVLAAVFIAIGVGIVITVINMSAEEKPDEEPGVAVVTGRAERQIIEKVLRYPGTLMSSSTVTVVPKIAGKIEHIAVDEGWKIEKNQLLVTLEDRTARIQAEQAYSAWMAADAQFKKAQRGVREQELDNVRASVRQAEEDLAAAEKNLERSKRLYDAGTIARAEYEKSDTAFGSAKTTLENAQRSLQLMEQGASSEELDMARSNAEALNSQYELAKLQLEYSQVRAPVSGTVAKVLVDSGNLVGAGTPLIAIVQEDPISVAIAVPEKHYALFSNDTSEIMVRVFATAYPSRKLFTGKISMVAPVIDVGSRTFSVLASVVNRERLLKPGMYVNTEIVVEKRPGVLVIPESTVAMRDGGFVVFKLVEGNSFHVVMIPVETGIRQGGKIEIASGIDDSDVLVIQGNAFLEDGQKVRVVEQR